MKLLLILFAGTGLILVLIALPLIDRRIKPNPFYGFRVRRTLEDAELWYAVNAHSGQRLLIAGLVMITAAIGLYFVPNLSMVAYALSITGIMVLTLAIGFVQTSRYLNQLDRDKDQ